MAGTHESTLTRFFDAWSRLDIDAALACVADTIVFEPDLKGARHEGKDAVATLWGKYMGMMRSYDYDTLAVLEQGGRAMIERIEVVGSSRGGETEAADRRRVHLRRRRQDRSLARLLG